MLFPVSGIEAPFFVPPLAAFAVSFLCSMGGVSGAFLLLPRGLAYGKESRRNGELLHRCERDDLSEQVDDGDQFTKRCGLRAYVFCMV